LFLPFTNRREFLAAAALAQSPPRSPNLLLLIGPWSAETTAPLEGSLRFTRYYAANPETAPARAAILTGRFPHACGVTRDGQSLAASEATIATVLRAAGYSDSSARAPYFAIAEPRRSPLAAQGRAADTIVCLASDFGTRAGEPTDDSVRGALAIRYPAALKPGESDALFSGVDIAPTLLGLCGLAVPSAMQGRDLSALLRGRGETPASVYCYGRLGTPREWRMIVRGYDKLVVDREGRATHLYNLAADPDESLNLAGDPSHQLKRDELLALLADRRRRIGDGVDPSGLKKR
jgi:arylsulfatase A-like enzyme